MYDVKMYQLADVTKFSIKKGDDKIVFEVEEELYGTVKTEVDYDRLEWCHENGHNLLLLMETNNVIFIDVCEVDELYEHYWEVEDYQEVEFDALDYELEVEEEVIDDIE